MEITILITLLPIILTIISTFNKQNFNNNTFNT